MEIPLFFDSQQVGKHIPLFLRRTDTVQHIVAVALEPFSHFFRIGEALRIGRRRKRLDSFTGLGMVAWRSRIFGMAGSAAPFVGVLYLEKTLPVRGRKLLKPRCTCRFLLNGSQYFVGGFRKSRLCHQTGNCGKRKAQYMKFTKHSYLL